MGFYEDLQHDNTIYFGHFFVKSDYMVCIQNEAGNTTAYVFAITAFFSCDAVILSHQIFCKSQQVSRYR